MTLRVIGVHHPDDGDVHIKGKLVTKLPISATSAVFQNYALWPHMTVAENLGFGLRIRKPREEIAKQGERARPVRLTAPAPLPARARRQQQRVAMARALAIDPRSSSSTSPCRTSTGGSARRCASN